MTHPPHIVQQQLPELTDRLYAAEVGGQPGGVYPQYLPHTHTQRRVQVPHAQGLGYDGGYARVSNLLHNLFGSYMSLYSVQHMWSLYSVQHLWSLYSVQHLWSLYSVQHLW